MRTSRLLLVVWLSLSINACSNPSGAFRATNGAAVPSVLDGLASDHPRILASSADFAELRRRVANDELARDWASSVRHHAEGILGLPLLEYEIPDGLRLLATSRRMVDRVLTLAISYRIFLDPRYLERAWRELAAVAAFPDWNPRHFLDTAEMLHAFAIGYDWLYDEWTVEQRSTLERAIVSHGLRPAWHCFRERDPHCWWTTAHNNWNLVCNGGVVMGALAVADRAPELAEQVVAAAVASVPFGTESYAPDGGYSEGPCYWSLATSYLALLLASMNSALGHDFGLSSAQGLAKTGFYEIYSTSPSGHLFTYSDCDPQRRPNSVPMWWLGRRYAKRAFAEFATRYATPTAYDLLYVADSDPSGAAARMPLDRYWRATETATFRGSWTDPDATFVGFKAGANSANHAHLEIGTFVVEALGESWAVDLGPEDYNLPGYFGDKRWDYYRTRAEGQNVLLIDPSKAPGQAPSAAARITRFESDGDNAFAIADLTPAYAENAAKVNRGVALQQRRDVLIQDEIETKALADVWWFMHTKAMVELRDHRRTAVLRQNGKQFFVRLVAPRSATIEVMTPSPMATSPKPPRQTRNAGFRKLGIHLANTPDVRIVVMLSPDDPARRRLSAVTKLEDW